MDVFSIGRLAAALLMLAIACLCAHERRTKWREYRNVSRRWQRTGITRQFAWDIFQGLLACALLSGFTALLILTLASDESVGSVFDVSLRTLKFFGIGSGIGGLCALAYIFSYRPKVELPEIDSDDLVCLVFDESGRVSTRDFIPIPAQ